MTYPQTINATQMRRINLSAVLDYTRSASPVSRTEIAKQLDLSLPTVMRIVDELIDDKLIIEDGEAKSSGGRRRSLLHFNEGSSVVIGVDMSSATIYGAISDLGGHILYEKTVTNHEGTSDLSFHYLVSLIRELISHVPEGIPLRGIGVGVPGVTSHQDGVVKWAASLNWRDFPLKSRLSQCFQYPIVVDNDVNMAALGELWFGLDEQKRNIVLITFGAGIGAGIIINGTLYRGATGASGEIGHFLLNCNFLAKDYLEFGVFETVASSSGIVARAREMLKDTLSAVDLQKLTANDVFSAARSGEPWADKIVQDTVDYLAVVLAGITTLIDPEVIILGGDISDSADILVDPVMPRLQHTIPHIPDIRISSLGSRAVIMGTITRILQHTVDYYVVRKL